MRRRRALGAPRLQPRVVLVARELRVAHGLHADLHGRAREVPDSERLVKAHGDGGGAVAGEKVAADRAREAEHGARELEPAGGVGAAAAHQARRLRAAVVDVVGRPRKRDRRQPVVHVDGRVKHVFKLVVAAAGRVAQEDRRAVGVGHQRRAEAEQAVVAGVKVARDRGVVVEHARPRVVGGLVEEEPEHGVVERREPVVEETAEVFDGLVPFCVWALDCVCLWRTRRG